MLPKNGCELKIKERLTCKLKFDCNSTKSAVVLRVNMRCTRAAVGQTLKPGLWTQSQHENTICGGGGGT